MTDITRAYLHTHEAVQRLTYVLEGQGVITATELGYIWGERDMPTPDPSLLLGAASPSERAADESDCAHGVITGSENRGITRENDRASDHESGARA